MQRKASNHIENSFLAILIVVMALVCLSVDGMLAWKHYSGGGTIAGCGPGGGCDAVSKSAWAVWLGIPVAVLGIGTYLCVLAALGFRKGWLLELLAGAIVAGALWFTHVQFFFIGRVCPWCMVGHVCGGVAALAIVLMRIGSAGLWKRMIIGLAAGLALLAGGQLLGPKPKTYRVETIEPQDGKASTSAESHPDADSSMYPHLGADDAPHVIVEYYDYTCPACRTMSGYIDALLRKHPGAFRVDMHPVPMERSCNPDAIEIGDEQRGSCEMARWALAVWRLAPEQFADYHTTLYADPTVENAAMLAAALIPPNELEGATSEPWIANYLQGNIADWKRYSKPVKKLPKLILGGKRLYHGIPANEAEFIQGIEKEFGLEK